MLTNGDAFGSGLASIGDFDGNGITDLAVGAVHDDDGGNELGAVYLIMLSPAFGVLAVHKISQTSGGFGGTLLEGGFFGGSIAGIGDLDNNGVQDIAVGVQLDGFSTKGAVWILRLAADGSVLAEEKLAPGLGNLEPGPESGSQFGASLEALGDWDGDGLPDLAVGAPVDDFSKGSVYLLHLSGSSWTDLGGGLAGTDGVPNLQGKGALVFGKTIDYRVDDVLGNALGFLVVGFGVANAPLKGGVLVPTPDLIIGGFSSFGWGVLTLEVPWPAGVPAALTLYHQWWFVDPAGPVGFSASNALSSTTPD
jgi:hypothetical protein